MEKESVLEAVYGLFLQEGIRDMRMRTIAGKLGITRHELCSLFPGKWELVAQCVEYGLQRLNTVLDAACASSRTPVEVLLRSAVTAYDAFGAMSWQFIEDIAYYPAAVDAVNGERRLLRKRQRSVFRQCVEEGYLLGMEYSELLEQFFWPDFKTESRHRDAALRVLFTIIRGSATERGWQETERVRRLMELSC